MTGAFGDWFANMLAVFEDEVLERSCGHRHYILHAVLLADTPSPMAGEPVPTTIGEGEPRLWANVDFQAYAMQRVDPEWSLGRSVFGGRNYPRIYSVLRGR